MSNSGNLFAVSAVRIRALAVLLAALSLLGCTGNVQEDAHVRAVQDFISVGELESIEAIPYRSDLRRHNLNEYFVILSSRRGDYLVAFSRRCVELFDYSDIKPDIRRDANKIYARFDTIRGCRIDAIYPLNKGQVEELKSLGDTPDATFE